MKNEEIVAKLRESLINISSRMVEPLVASKYEHVFILDKDISDCNESKSKYPFNLIKISHKL